MLPNHVILIDEWKHMWHNHRRITNEIWIHGSPRYGVVNYHIPDWNFWATRHAQIVEKPVLHEQGAEHGVMRTVEYEVWQMEMPYLLLEMRIPQRMKHMDAMSNTSNFWIYLFPQYEEMNSLEHVGDLNEFESMLAYYKLTYDWPPVS